MSLMDTWFRAKRYDTFYFFDHTVTLEALSALHALQRGLCALCEKPPSQRNNWHRSLSLDHIVPLSRGGVHTIRNLQFLCISCNSTKNAKLPPFVSRNRSILDHPDIPNRLESIFALPKFSSASPIEDISYEQ